MIVILGPLVGLTTSAVTLTFASLLASVVTVDPSTSSSGVSSMLSPLSPFTLSMMRTSPTDTCANDRVHVGLTLLRLFGEVATGNRHIVSEGTRARWAHRGVRLLAQQPMNQTHCWPHRAGRHLGEARRGPRCEDACVGRARQAPSPVPPASPQ